MKVIAFNGSPRPEGNTAQLLDVVLSAIATAGHETELVQLGGSGIQPCNACYSCFESKDSTCPSIQDDVLNEFARKAFEADGLLIGSPTYFANVTPEVKAFIDRLGLLAIANDYALSRKVGAGVVAVRRAGSTNVFDAINKFFLINQMIVPGSVYWNMGIGRNPGDVVEDEEGQKIMRVLGENIAWLLDRLQ